MNVLTESLLKTLSKIAACICIALGLIGAFLPVLPTTPFLLLATFFSYRSSPKIRQWLLEHPVFGETIQNYFDDRSISISALRSALVTLWLCMALSVWLIQNVWISLLLVAIGLGVTTYLLGLKRSD